jgi:glycosyltransferase involved in cell wall biosynthesis
MIKSKPSFISLSIVIPCLNEDKTISRAVRQARIFAQKWARRFEVIVADNGSTDGTLKKLSILKKQKKIKLVKVPIRGYGAALHHGILAAKFPYVIYADADLSYSFTEIKKFIPYLINNYDLVLGSRLNQQLDHRAMPWSHRYVGTPILSGLIRYIYHIPTSDSNSGMRAVKVKFYKQLNMKYAGMEWASELLIKAALKQGRYAEIQICFKKDQRGAQPHLRRWVDGWKHLKVILLLSPSILIYLAAFFFGLSLIFLHYSLFTTIALNLFTEFLILSYLLVCKLESGIWKTHNIVNDWLNKTPLVLIGLIINLIGLLAIFLISDRHLYTKYILVFQVVIYDLWLFFIETINTHLINVLPEKT